MKRVLVAEDEQNIREFVVINLQRAGYEIIEAETGDQALEVYDRGGGQFDVVILDIMMPGAHDGLAVCRELRGRNPSIGVILLTAKTQEMDKVSGLMMGADDYVTKPFSPSELTARVDAIHRRVTMVNGRAGDSFLLSSGPFVLNQKSRSLKKNGKDIDLTQVEFQIMEYFMSNPGTALERSEILNKVWGENYFGDIKIVDVNIRRLRMKIEDQPSDPKFLVTVWGFGYKWNV